MVQIQIMTGMIAVLAIIADLMSIYTFVNTVRMGQYSDIPRKVLTIILIFVFAVFMYFLSRKSTTIPFGYIIFGFAHLYLFFSAISILMSSTVLKGNKMRRLDYAMFALSSLLIFSLGVFLLLIVGKGAQYISLMFFSCGIIQIFYLIGEYILKMYIEAKDEIIPNQFLGEYPFSIKMFLMEMKELPGLLSGNVNPVNRDANIDFKGISYQHFTLDCIYLLFCTTLGVIVLIIKDVGTIF